LELNCPFCEIVKEGSRVVSKDDSFFVIRDGYPVTEGHSLIIPNEHISDVFDLNGQELIELHWILTEQRLALAEEDETITGFNVGFNSGVDAGQTIDHAHVHLIPRRKGDMKDPTGGVRGVIPEKQKYL
jgi:ATP adenylyltransferase